MMPAPTSSTPAGGERTPIALQPARTLPEQRDGARLLAIDPGAGRFAERRVDQLPALLRPGDLLVVNDAATLPASLAGQDRLGRAVEVRLIAQRRPGSTSPRFQAVLFGAGDWRQDTALRPPPPPVAPGDRLRFADLQATIVAVSALSPRLVQLRFDRRGQPLWAALYRLGRPVQYAHLAQPLPLWAVQNVYAGRPWAFEMPSAGRPLTWRILRELPGRDIGLCSLTHAAGLSATGDPHLDARMPLPEAYEIPQATVSAVTRTRLAGGRVVAVGTTVVRALEGAHARGGLRAGRGRTDLRLGPGSHLQVVDGLLSGLHAPGESHFDLLAALAGPELLLRATTFAAARGFRSHELGDLSLVLAASLDAAPGWTGFKVGT